MGRTNLPIELNRIESRWWARLRRPITAVIFILVGIATFGSATFGSARSVWGQSRETVSPVHFDAEPARRWMIQHCGDCHADGAGEGGFEIETLRNSVDEEAELQRWLRVLDRVERGEMPPPDAGLLTHRDIGELRGLLEGPLASADRPFATTVLRRLNRREYENTLNDLFGTHLDLATLLPEDGRSHEFDNVGKSLHLSTVQLQRYVDAMEAVLDAAIASDLEPPERKNLSASYAETRGASRFIGKQWHKLDDGAIVFYRRNGYPSGMLREASAKEAGWYKIRVTGYAHQSDRPITFSVGATTFARGADKPTFGYYELPPGDPTEVELTAWLNRRYMVELTPWGIGDPQNLIKRNGIDRYPGPGLAVMSIELDGPLVDEYPGPGHRLIFDGLDRREVPPKNPSRRRKSWYEPKFEIGDASDSAIRQSLLRVARKAFRRPVDGDDVARYETLYREELAHTGDVERALRTAIAAMFCSVDFLYLIEPEGRLDDHALASRLSYLLHRTSPDSTLAAVADAGHLAGRPRDLLDQTARLIRDEKFERFIVDFTDAWLNLRDIDATRPDQRLFPEYDEYLQDSMIRETRATLRDLIIENRSIRDLVSSDRAMLNERLAAHYGFGDPDSGTSDRVRGPTIRAVTLPEGSVRGGLLGQAAVLKVSANGTNTSPVLRGVWVLERLLGEVPPPPPPGVAGVEPDIRGATTLRELLAMHRDSIDCQGCHARIDPHGFALESFDPIGRWRDRFRSLGAGSKVDRRVGNRRVRYRFGPSVDDSGMTVDGVAFDGFEQYRDWLAGQPRRLAIALTNKFMTFATGREMRFSDAQAIAAIVDATADDGYPMGDLLRGVISSETFATR